MVEVLDVLSWSRLIKVSFGKLKDTVVVWISESRVWNRDERLKIKHHEPNSLVTAEGLKITF
jgi:hypothetical protein